MNPTENTTPTWVPPSEVRHQEGSPPSVDPYYEDPYNPDPYAKM